MAVKYDPVLGKLREKDWTQTQTDDLYHKLTGNVSYTITGTKKTTLQGSASGSDKVIYFPNLSGTVALASQLPVITGKEDIANKSTNVTSDGNSDTKYPSVKSIKDYTDTMLGSKVNGADGIMDYLQVAGAAGVEGFKGAINMPEKPATIDGMYVSITPNGCEDGEFPAELGDGYNYCIQGVYTVDGITMVGPANYTGEQYDTAIPPYNSVYFSVAWAPVGDGETNFLVKKIVNGDVVGYFITVDETTTSFDDGFWGTSWTAGDFTDYPETIPQGQIDLAGADNYVDFVDADGVSKAKIGKDGMVVGTGLAIVDGGTGPIVATDGVLSVGTAEAQKYTRLFSHYATVDSQTTSETDLYSDTTAASTLASAGDTLEGMYGGVLANSANNKTVKVYWAGNLVFNSQSMALTALMGWRVDYTIIRSGASTSRANVQIRCGSAYSYASQAEQSGITYTNTNIIKVSGQGGATNDVEARVGTVNRMLV